MLQPRPTTRASTSRPTGSAAAKMAASTRSIHSRQRSVGGRSASSRSKSSFSAFACRVRSLLWSISAASLRSSSQPIDPKRRTAGQFTHSGKTLHKCSHTARKDAEVLPDQRCSAPGFSWQNDPATGCGTPNRGRAGLSRIHQIRGRRLTLVASQLFRSGSSRSQ
jgi:hypothetical protein